MFLNDMIEILRDTRDDRLFDILKNEGKELILTKIFYGEFPKIENNDEELRLIRIFLDFHLKKIDKIDDFIEIRDQCVDFLKINFNFSIFNIVFNIGRLKKIELSSDYYFEALKKTIFIFQDSYVKKIPYDDLFKIVDVLKSIAKVVNENIFDIQHNSIEVYYNTFQEYCLENQEKITRKIILIQLNKFIDIIFPKAVLEVDPYRFDEDFIIKFFCKINCNDLMVRILEQRYIPDLYHFAFKEKILTDVAKKMKKYFEKKHCKEKLEIRLPKNWGCDVGFKVIPR